MEVSRHMVFFFAIHLVGFDVHPFFVYLVGICSFIPPLGKSIPNALLFPLPHGEVSQAESQESPQEVRDSMGVAAVLILHLT